MNTTKEPEPLTTTLQRAEQISGLGKTKLYECIKDGRLKTVTVDRRRLVLYSSLKALVGVA